jgi:hypothetical protein
MQPTSVTAFPLVGDDGEDAGSFDVCPACALTQVRLKADNYLN